MQRILARLLIALILVGDGPSGTFRPPVWSFQELPGLGAMGPGHLEKQLAAGEYTLALSGGATLALSGGDRLALSGGAMASNQTLTDNAVSNQVWEHRRRAEQWGVGLRSQSAVAEGLGLPGASSPGGLAGKVAGAAGGMVQADFDSLINLIQTVIEPDTWEENGGPSAINTFRNGVVIDVAGQLRFEGPLKKRSRSLLAVATPPLKLVKDAELRFISLPKLESQLRSLAREGRPIPESLRYLGGLYEIHAVAVDATAGDLFLVGAAGPWEINDQGVAVNLATGRPVFHLDDLVACFRNVMFGRSILGCSIDPRPGQFEKAAELAAKWNLTVPQVRTRFLATVGPQNTAVFGVPNWSHAAQVLLTADYHIKLLAMGSINAGPQLPSFLDRCEADDPPSEIIRWWFTLAEPSVNQSEDGNLYTIEGPVMELKTEAKFVAGQPAAGQAAPPKSLAAESFVSDFNRQLPQMRRLFPVYGQLENLFHLAVVAQLIHGQKLAAKVGWQPSLLVGQREGTLQYALQRYPEIREVELVINHRTLQGSRIAGGGRNPRQVIVAISGGVEVNATPEKVAAALHERALHAFPVALRTGPEGVRPTLAPVNIGAGEATTSLLNSIWFADQ